MPCSKVSISKNYKCDKAGCICIPTGGKPCICVCENENGDIMRCDECKCSNSDTCQCKCDDSKCTCIVTKGADCVCVCRDERGNFKTCDCCCVDAKEQTCCKKEVNEKSCGCCNEKSLSGKDARDSICKCDSKKECKQSPRVVTSNKNYKCNKAVCVCIPTDGKSCICVCENENGDIMRCDDCKCSNSDTCQCKCDDSKCTCNVTKGADCVCICRDERGNFKTYDCCCVEAKEPICCKKEVNEKSRRCCNEKSFSGKDVQGSICKCDSKKEIKQSPRGVTINKNYKCDKAGCVCIPTDGKSCVCVCENENGDIMRCDDCKCFNFDTCQCKCDDSKCTCLVSNGADCICICRDERGNLEVCNCCCIEAKETTCCKEKVNEKPRGCYNKTLDKEGRGTKCKCDGKKERECDDCKCADSGYCKYNCGNSKYTCIATKGANYICVCRDEKENFKTCDCCCIQAKETASCKKEVRDAKSRGCYDETSFSEKEACSSICKYDNKKEFKQSPRRVTYTKNFKCYKSGCVCIPTEGKSRIYVCENKNGDIIQCDDCECFKSDTYQCKCDDSKCTCIITHGADCVCVCRDGRGYFEVCNCCCETKDTSCDKKEVNVTCEWYNKKPEKQTYNCQCDSKKKVEEFSGGVTCCNNRKCDKAGCSCLPTGGKPYVRLNEDNSNAFLCQSFSRKCCCKKPAYNNEQQNISYGQSYRYADYKGHKHSFSLNNEEPNCKCKNNILQKSSSDRSTKSIKISCCNYDKIQDNKKIDAKQRCVCVSRGTRYRYVPDAACLCVTKKVATPCLCCY